MSGGQSFPRRSRLLKPAEFKRVFNQPVVSSDRLFKVFARPGTASWCRIGMAVSRKVDSRAVVRNRIKRVIRESFRRNYRPADEGTKPGKDIVIVASPAAARAAGGELANSLSEHWRTIDRKLEKRLSDSK
jgi:ribonuclease P protein component